MLVGEGAQHHPQIDSSTGQMFVLAGWALVALAVLAGVLGVSWPSGDPCAAGRCCASSHLARGERLLLWDWWRSC